MFARKSPKLLLILSLIIFMTACGHKPIAIQIPNELPPPAPLPEIKVALVLGSGGARGVAHVGVISVLEENNIPIDLIVGTSAGSVVGALYADEPKSDALKQKLLKASKREVIDPNIYTSMKMLWSVGGVANGDALRAYLYKYLSADDFNKLSIPFAAVTTDIEEGKLYVIRSGPIIPAVHASSAIPFVFTPVTLYQRMLADGGIMSPVPVEVAKELGAQKVIAVDISAIIKPTKVKGMYQFADRCLWLSYIALSDWQNQQSDVLIQPEFPPDVSMFDDTNLESFYESGRQAALKALPQIKAMLSLS